MASVSSLRQIRQILKTPYVWLLALLMSLICLSLENWAVKASTPAESPAAGLVRQLYAAPLLEKGKSAWVSIYDHKGNCCADASLDINGALVRADSSGICKFTVPEANKVRLCVVGASGESLSLPVNYTESTHGFLVQETNVADAFEKLLELGNGDISPRVLYAPAVVDKLSSFLVIGRNFSGRFQEDKVCLDGQDADLFGGSSVCLLARAPAKSSVGPLKELFVMSSGEASNSREIDLCRLDLASQDSGSANRTQVKVVASGTSMPCIFELATDGSAKLRLRGKAIGPTAVVVSPGGDQNHIVFDVDGAAKTATQAVLLADPLLEPTLLSSGNNGLRQLSLELDKAQTCRLQRRFIALDLRLQAAQARRAKLLADELPEASEVEACQNEVRAISLRKDRLARMIACQRALIEGSGGTAQDFSGAIGQADCGAVLDLEATLKRFDIFAKTLTVARAERRKRASKETSFPQAEDHFRAPPSQHAFVPPAKEFKTFASIAPRAARLIAPPTPYTPKMQELEPYMLSGYTPPLPTIRAANRAANAAANSAKKRKHSASTKRKSLSPGKRLRKASDQIPIEPSAGRQQKHSK